MAASMGGAAGRWSSAAGRTGAARRAQAGSGGWPVAGAAVAGCVAGLALMGGLAVLAGVGQRLGLVGRLPDALYLAGAYLGAAVGGWLAGRLARRAGMVSGAVAGVLLAGVALWVGLGAAGQAQGATVLWGAALWRSLLGVVVGGLAGALGVG